VSVLADPTVHSRLGSLGLEVFAYYRQAPNT
jgi:hypothetical protein